MAKNGMTMIGAILVLIGLIGLAIPYFTTAETKEVARIGDLKLQATEHKTYSIPPIAAGGALLVGVVLIGAGVYGRRA